MSLKQTAVDTLFVEFEGTVEAPNQLRETDRAYFGGNFGKWHHDTQRLLTYVFAMFVDLTGPITVHITKLAFWKAIRL